MRDGLRCSTTTTSSVRARSLGVTPLRWPTLVAALVLAAALVVGSHTPARAADPPCAAIALFAVPGSGETTAGADPASPTGLLAALTAAPAARWGGQLHVEYLPYPAAADRLLSYLLSEARGVDALTTVTTAYAARCPDARLLLLGYSQGADVVSDLVHRAARGTVALNPDRIAGAWMLGSPRRDPRAPNLVPAPGHGLLGPRPTRELAVYAGRVVEVCATNDPICATESLDATRFREALASGAHRSYPTLPVTGRPFDAVLGDAIATTVTDTAPPA